jgi:hypothetical protein
MEQKDHNDGDCTHIECQNMAMPLHSHSCIHVELTGRMIPKLTQIFAFFRVAAGVTRFG